MTPAQMDGVVHISDGTVSASPSPSSSAVPRNALLFDPSAPEVKERQNGEKEEEEEDDQFYEINAGDLRLMLKALQDESKRQGCLVPAQLLKERDQQLKQKAYKRTIVRFRLHTGHILQAQFLSTEPVSALFIFLRQIVAPSFRFELRQIPPTADKLSAENDVTSLLDAGIAPKSVLILKLERAEQSPDALTTDTDQIFMPGICRNCTQAEAMESANEWLTSNTEFRPYLDTVLDMFPSLADDSAASRRAAVPSSPVMPSSTTTPRSGDESTNNRGRNEDSGGRTKSNSELPKWLKRKN